MVVVVIVVVVVVLVVDGKGTVDVSLRRKEASLLSLYEATLVRRRRPPSCLIHSSGRLELSKET